MNRTNFQIGDMVFLKSTSARWSRADGAFEIRSILPAAGGMAEYRVRSVSENFDRRISAGDIDMELTSRPRLAVHAGSKIQEGSWIKSASIRVSK